MKTTKEKIEVMQAHLDGEVVQRKSCNSNEWIDCSSAEMTWNWGAQDYRVKKKPFVCYSVIDDNWRIRGSYSDPITAREVLADYARKHDASLWRACKLQEVIDDQSSDS